MSFAVWVGVVLLPLALALASALSSSPYPCIPDPDSFELLVATKLLLLDCDSTLSSIEGIDELIIVEAITTKKKTLAAVQQSVSMSRVVLMLTFMAVAPFRRFPR